MEKMEENPLSEEDRQRIIDGLMNRKIWRYYKMLSKWAPMLMMLGHWYGVWDYGRHPRAMVLDTEMNGNCIIWIYVLAYVYTPLAMIPVSYFFRYCWIYRIPFFYFFGINAIRLYYRHWLITPEQLEMHHVFIIFTLILYNYGIIKIALTRGWFSLQNVARWRMWLYRRGRRNREKKPTELDGGQTPL